MAAFLLEIKNMISETDTVVKSKMQRHVDATMQVKISF